ncbi:hypothetical protein B9Z55_015702 [Caenorhabditis nigoni]|nr:hypothetical protein B9Z55_015702 [Caenorhabditis nigoni]
MRGIEDFLNLKALPHASFSFEAIAEATCDPPVIEGGEIVTEQPIKLSPIEYSGFVLGTNGKEISKIDSTKTSFLFVVSSDSEGLVLGPMPPLATRKGMLFSKGLETDMTSEEQRRVIRRRLASTETSQLAQYVKKARCHMIVASHTDESKDPAVGEVLEALEATSFNTEVLEMLRKNPAVLPNCAFVDRVLPVCEDFFHRATSTLKAKDYKKLFIDHPEEPKRKSTLEKMEVGKTGSRSGLVLAQEEGIRRHAPNNEGSLLEAHEEISRRIRHPGN